MASLPAQHYPEQVVIDAYGNHGFRFADMSHRGSLLALPSGMYGWNGPAVADLSEEDFGALLSERDRINFVLFGTGAAQQWAPPGVRKLFAQLRIGLEMMDTGAAVRTYNVLLNEQRPLAAIFMAVDLQSTERQ